MKLVLNKNAVVNRVYLEKCTSPVYVIDDVLVNPHEVISFAENTAYFLAPGRDGTLYPGIRDLMPKAYENMLQELMVLINESNKEFYFHRALLSLVTLSESELSDYHSLPHVDSIDKNEYASVHYFCDEAFGGTSLYSYKPRDIMQIGEGDVNIFQEALDKNQEKGYLQGDNSLFKRELKIEAKFNRLVMYQSNILHCADINTNKSISKSPTNGRLTVASFYQLNDR
ncbi:hypothetical protein N474_02270 [Pseudoalteromonas luteoviolacea CPMOR-2]|uniref:Prolyl 4-hydroxylase alpha subunit Fe(2+) 2OG dioxygenase domain-containing protein n=2 Tax=Pseudoalteromonas luteoviolacea TaxID=43657 RepID=A0A166V4T6_9GAMM|nr:DUF6445 family protein [Pseudoalteromonas luteoviolacea]KZN31711.1 hypothetical protein N475_04450 [Pseudoalteromonas luteoviolacea DSM 6061]KZN54571.1 hypothetical protein N474_02270 [Pseudoalteromonas luteoviolacea CPMOR-2]MBE0389048.1 hypothetical protein [Pseudoalteromonas luteoviolacea DSM 6061]